MRVKKEKRQDGVGTILSLGHKLQLDSAGARHTGAHHAVKITDAVRWNLVSEVLKSSPAPQGAKDSRL